MKDRIQVNIDGTQVESLAGETVLEAAQRAGVEIPTLCHDSRLDPAGCCRMCLVEVEGERRLQPACTWKATDECVSNIGDRSTRKLFAAH